MPLQLLRQCKGGFCVLPGAKLFLRSNLTQIPDWRPVFAVIDAGIDKQIVGFRRNDKAIRGVELKRHGSVPAGKIYSRGDQPFVLVAYGIATGGHIATPIIPSFPDPGIQTKLVRL